MDSKGSECSHINQTIDMITGDNICIDCGLVLDKVYVFPHKDGKNLENFFTDDDFLAELLEKLHLPKNVASYVNRELEGLNGANCKYSQLSIARCLYRAVAKLDMPITARDICAVSGFSSKKILNQPASHAQRENSSIICISIDSILEKLCGNLSISFKDSTLIKKSVKVRYSGFNPATVAAAYVYLYCKKNLKNIKLKDICMISGISCMSVHRFIKKNDLSRGP